MPLLEVKNLRCSFHTRNGVHRAVNGVDFTIERGEILGLVGESGSGKSVTCHSLIGLVPTPPGKIDSGTAIFDGTDLLACTPSQLRAIRGKRISMVFQDPMTSLNPYLRISEQLIEPLLIHTDIGRKQALVKAAQMLRAVGIQDADTRMTRYPHEFSGGMRQRVMIAMALITGPELLIADEPTTALDVTVQAQIVELLQRLQKETGMAVLYITHDLGVVAGLCHRVQVMYAGRIVESAPVRDLYANARHPYTRALLRSIPSTHQKGERLQTIAGMPPDLREISPGCAFAARCNAVQESCRNGEAPALRTFSPLHTHACLRDDLNDEHTGPTD